ncbi:hypothetical protein H8S90_12235 [Olivibacter sp. SDN3]|nr:hypothetical protein H8S90_12235 [Olivibacter sp. SDN3]
MLLIQLVQLSFAVQGDNQKHALTILISEKASPRIQYGVEKLTEAFRASGYQIRLTTDDVTLAQASQLLIIGKIADPIGSGIFDTINLSAKEAFQIHWDTAQGKSFIAGADDNGVLYGCLELAERLDKEGQLPMQLQKKDHPEMLLRGTAIGIQKTHYLPGRTVYEYPYTPEEFPWLYDKEQWIRYLDMLVENRYNSLYLWNGHPFASLVRLADYPYAVEVDEETFKKNEEIFQFITKEADKRGIWVIQMFYNIIVSKPFAEKHDLKTQDRNRPILPLIADYTRKSIAAFVEKYPNVGLLVTLGEAMEGVGQDDIDWFTKTIIPGVQEGLKRIGEETEPPIVLRAHDTDAPAVMKASLPLYKNLYTMAKYNGEALTTYTPRGKWAELHQTLSKAAPVHIQNVHILANLEPFRYASPDFIQKSVQAMHNIHYANGLHVYPQASYWDWPYAADRLKDTTARLLQIDRDWMWYKAWARYAWNAGNDRNMEEAYWSDILAGVFGTDNTAGRALLESYEELGEIAPKLLRRYGITDGNRQTLSLGMFMPQLINPFRFSLFTLLYESEAPEGEMLIDYAKKEWNGEPHIGETPVQVADEVVAHGKNAVLAIEKVASQVTQEKEEFNRIKNDVYCYDALANFYAEKVRAALLVLRYKYSSEVGDLDKALPHLENSIWYFKKLTTLTDDSYLYANSMQTTQRKIPIRGIDGNYKKWDELLPLYEQELSHFKRQIDSLKHHPEGTGTVEPLEPVAVKLIAGSKGFYALSKDAKPFGSEHKLVEVATSLAKLKGIRMDADRQRNLGSQITFDVDQPAQLLVGFFKEKDAAFGSEKESENFAPAPELERDASANDYGQSDVLIANALLLEGYPPVYIHAYRFPPGKHTLTIPKGECLLLGFTDAKEFKSYDAEVGIAVDERNIDWLFE